MVPAGTLALGFLLPGVITGYSQAPFSPLELMRSVLGE